MSIQLHPEKGVNPRLSVCQRCGKDVGIVLLGRFDKKYTCPSCNCVHYGPPEQSKKNPEVRGCGKCDNTYDSRNWKVEPVEDYEKLPGGLCDDCMDKQAACDEAVKNGGVFWKCSTCGSAGALRPEAELAKAVRKQTGIKAPDPVGIEFNKDDCPVCGPNPVKEEDDAKVPGS